MLSVDVSKSSTASQTFLWPCCPDNSPLVVVQQNWDTWVLLISHVESLVYLPPPPIHAPPSGFGLSPFGTLIGRGGEGRSVWRVQWWPSKSASGSALWCYTERCHWEEIEGWVYIRKDKTTVLSSRQLLLKSLCFIQLISQNSNDVWLNLHQFDWKKKSTNRFQMCAEFGTNIWVSCSRYFLELFLPASLWCVRMQQENIWKIHSEQRTRNGKAPKEAPYMWNGPKKSQSRETMGFESFWQ